VHASTYKDNTELLLSNT